MEKTNTWSFPSSSSSKVYQTLRWSDGTYSCDCPGWTFKKKGVERTCSHIKNILALPKVGVPGIPKGGAAGTGSAPKSIKQIIGPDPQTWLKKLFKPEFFKPMLAQPIDKLGREKLMKDPRFVAEPKFDGQRALVFVENAKTVACYSRLGNDLLYTKANGVKWLAEVKWPFDSAVLDAELCSNGGLAVAAKDAAHAYSWAGMDTELIVFDMLSFNGIDLKGQPWSERRLTLEKTFQHFKNAKVQITPVSDDAVALWKKWVEKMGGEGIMLKEKSSIYRPGQRSWQWLKIKNEITVDVVVTGIANKATYSGKGYKTAEAALTYGFWDPKKQHSVTVGQGMRFGKKEDLVELIGKVAEMRCAGVMASGGLRHGFFVRWRDDKAATECLMPGIGKQN